MVLRPKFLLILCCACVLGWLNCGEEPRFEALPSGATGDLSVWIHADLLELKERLNCTDVDTVESSPINLELDCRDQSTNQEYRLTGYIAFGENGRAMFNYSVKAPEGPNQLYYRVIDRDRSMTDSLYPGNLDLFNDLNRDGEPELLILDEERTGSGSSGIYYLYSLSGTGLDYHGSYGRYSEDLMLGEGDKTTIKRAGDQFTVQQSFMNRNERGQILTETTIDTLSGTDLMRLFQK